MSYAASVSSPGGGRGCFWGLRNADRECDRPEGTANIKRKIIGALIQRGFSADLGLWGFGFPSRATKWADP